MTDDQLTKNNGNAQPPQQQAQRSTRFVALGQQPVTIEAPLDTRPPAGPPPAEGLANNIWGDELMRLQKDHPSIKISAWQLNQAARYGDETHYPASKLFANLHAAGVRDNKAIRMVEDVIRAGEAARKASASHAQRLASREANSVGASGRTDY